MLTHLGGYRFFSVEDPQWLSDQLWPLCESLDLKGTILLSEEGINLYLSGLSDNLAAFERELQDTFHVPPLKKNETECPEHLYDKFRIKIKKEIVTTGKLAIRVAEETGPEISPEELKTLFESGKSFTLLDTRNAFEVALGKFEGASDLDVRSFRKFSAKAESIPDEIKERPLVMYCTGGIRCEKSSAQFLRHLGFKEVYKLQGGILNYFKECGGAHWEGECFVFDDRVGLDPDLKPTGSVVCERCQWIVTAEQQKRPDYEEGKSCWHCWGKDVEPHTGYIISN